VRKELYSSIYYKGNINLLKKGKINILTNRELTMRTGKKNILGDVESNGTSIKPLVGNINDLALTDEILTKDINSQNLLLNGTFNFWYAGTSVAPDAWITSGTGTITREGTIVKDSTLASNYSAKIINGASSAYSLIHNLHPYDVFSKDITFSCWVYASDANRVRLTLRHASSYTYSSYHTGSGNWEELTVTKTMSTYNTAQASITISSGTAITVYVDEAIVVKGSVPFAYSPHPEDHLYKQTEIGINYHRVTVGDSNDNFNGVIVNANGYAHCKNVNQYMIFALPIPTELYNHPIMIDDCTIYYNTQANGDYITRVDIFTLDGDGSTTVILTHTGDMGNGTSGDESHDVVDTQIEITAGNSGVGIYLQFAGADLNTDQRIYGMNIKYHCKVHG